MRLYPNLTRLLMPLAGFWLRWRARREPEWGFRLADRFGRGEAAADAPVWIHAASVGEVNSAAVLLAAIRQRWPGLPLRLTAFTATGCQRWRELTKGRPGVTVAPWPLDHPRWVARALDAVRPRAVLIVETEIWPNFLCASHRRRIPVLMVSARISERSRRGWERWLGERTLRASLEPIAYVGVQSAADGERFQALGARQVRVDGSLKWDAAAALPVDSQLQSVQEQLAGRHSWLAASTHEGEEVLLLEAHRQLRTRFPGLCLILAPRHPRRTAAVLELCAQAGFSTVQRSGQAAVDGADVWLVDTLGELTTFMRAAEVVFMGGSLLAIGGHNLLEPVACGRPIVTGPDSANAADVAAALSEVQALVRASTSDEVVRAVGCLLGDARRAQEQAARAREVLGARSGALQRAIDALALQMEPRS